MSITYADRTLLPDLTEIGRHTREALNELDSAATTYEGSAIP
ncbi:hypothetical protein [Rhodococcus sp. USK13]|nr:hypothetical protein [Rhodococcus sp. USK13]